MKKTTINDVAKKAGVSKSAVSAVINSKGNIGLDTRNRILAVIKELNFTPKTYTRNNKSKKIVDIIGLIIKDLDNPFYTKIAMGIKEYANEHGYLVFIMSSENKNEFERLFSEQFTIKNIKGAIIAPVLDGKAEIEHLFMLKQNNFPFVLLEKVNGIYANVVSINNIVAMKTAVKYLIDTGHKKIVHFAGPENSTHAHERIEGFRMAYSESHLKLKEDMIVNVGAHYDESFEKTIDYFQNRNPKEYPTAIICFNDQQVMGVFSALNRLSIRVPEDISIIGNDDITHPNSLSIPLTTIHAPLNEMGKKAAEILINNIKATEALPAEEVILDAEFIVRKSTRILK